MTTNAHNYPWHDASPPDIAAGRKTGRLRACGYCGSMHPADVAAALRSGARLDPSDRKYGWPHKFYVENVPNPHAGMLESRCSPSHATPFCPKRGAPCEHGEQSFYHPTCECMKETPEQIATGEGSTGYSVIAINTGRFHEQTGKPKMDWTETGKPASETTYGKFYTEHLKDASPEDRDVIEKAMGMHVEFSGGQVTWWKYGIPKPEPIGLG
nr:hypothetical protein [Dechloromonas sp.]